MEKLALNQTNRHLIIGSKMKGIIRMRMAFAKFLGWLDKPRNQNEIPCNGLNFPNYIYPVGKLCAWRKMVNV